MAKYHKVIYIGKGVVDDNYTYGETYTAIEEGALFTIPDDYHTEYVFTIFPDDDGCSYRDWFILEGESMPDSYKPVENDTMWIVVYTDTYYPSILHFGTEEKANEWVDQYLKQYPNIVQDCDCFYIAEVKKHIKGADFDQDELTNNDVEHSVCR